MSTDDILSRYRIRSVWHFTDQANLPLIRQYGGLMSIGEIERRDMSIPAPGGNEWSHQADRIKGVHDYVHLALIRDHPMLFRAKQDGRIKSPVWLEIDSAILRQEGVRYTSDVANKTGVPLLFPEEALKYVDFEVLFEWMDWKQPEVKDRRKAALKSEALIPRFVPVSMIRGVQNG